MRQTFEAKRDSHYETNLKMSMKRGPGFLEKVKQKSRCSINKNSALLHYHDQE